jgi:metal-responsive CopG/Arc/MetJ family transcriptional regulator
MAALRASYTIEPDLLLKFNELVPSGERSRLIQKLMAQAVAERQKALEAMAHEFETHADFARARADATAFETTVSDGLDD